MKLLVSMFLGIIGTMCGIIFTEGGTQYAFQVAFFVVLVVSVLLLMSGATD